MGSEMCIRDSDIGILAECAAVKIGAYVRNYEVTELNISRDNPIVQRSHGERRVCASVQTCGGNDRYRGLIKRWWSEPFHGTYRRHSLCSHTEMVRLDWVKIAQPNHRKIVGRLALTEKNDLLTKERLSGKQPTLRAC